MRTDNNDAKDAAALAFMALHSNCLHLPIAREPYGNLSPFDQTGRWEEHRMQKTRVDNKKTQSNVHVNFERKLLVQRGYPIGVGGEKIWKKSRGIISRSRTNFAVKQVMSNTAMFPNCIMGYEGLALKQ